MLPPTRQGAAFPTASGAATRLTASTSSVALPAAENRSSTELPAHADRSAVTCCRPAVAAVTCSGVIRVAPERSRTDMSCQLVEGVAPAPSAPRYQKERVIGAPAGIQIT